MLLRLPWQRKRDPEPVEKAAQFPPGARTSDMSALVRAMTEQMGHYDLDAEGRPLPRPQEWLSSQFGPQWPLTPLPLDQPRPDSDLPEPRVSEYPFSWNLQYNDAKAVSWETLRLASETPLFRACIETRKTELCELDWAIQISKTAAEDIARKSRKSRMDVENDLREKHEEEIKRLTDFWTMPDRRNGREFSEWIGVLLEEQLTWDAMAIYPRRTYGGDLSDLLIIDGSTIKPLLDEQGARPLPPAPAYQQILYGFPRGEFTADTVDADGKSVVPGGLTATQLIYRRRVVRNRTPYGYSPTEQALLDGLLYNKRYGWMVAEYTEGTQPAQFLENTGDVDWSARQLLQYEKAFNDRFSGNTNERYRYALLPPGIRPAALQQIQERYKSDYDLHLIARVAMHFGVMLPELGFTDKGNGLGSAGYHEGNESVMYRRSRLPDIRWFARLITYISRSQLGMPPELEFQFLGLEEEDEADIDAVIQNKTASGRLTLNEARSLSGLPPFDFEEADKPMLQTARGVVFLEGASETAPGGILVEPSSEFNAIQAGPSAAGVNDQSVSQAQRVSQQAKQETGQVQSPTQRRPIGSGGGGNAAKEVESFRRWLSKRREPSRQFEFTVPYAEAVVVDSDLIHGNFEKATFPPSGGGAGPKASSNSSLHPSSPQPSSGLDGLLISASQPYKPKPS